MKVLITGSNGYVGSSLSKILAENPSFEIIKHSRNMFDLSDQQAVFNHFKTNEYDVVIHAASTGGSRLSADDSTVLQNNLNCFYNLYENREKFGKLISFGSGSEFNKIITPYSLSKRCINAQIQSTENFYNLRIYAVFDENELHTRFIKSAILNYINKKSIVVHQDKFMDFFAMQDLARLVEHFCVTDSSQLTNRVIDCCYDEKFKLTDVANFVNTLGDYKCDVIVNNATMGEDYIGYANAMPVVEQIGLHKGIEYVYEKMLYNLQNH